MNKIDDVEENERQKRIQEFKAYLMNNLGDEILSETNSIISLDCLSLIEESNYLENFENYLTYKLKEYISS